MTLDWHIAPNSLLLVLFGLALSASVALLQLCLAYHATMMEHLHGGYMSLLPSLHAALPLAKCVFAPWSGEYTSWL